ncbi:hypothetical protein ABW20_dc0108890 [Dactylellina cionopaga]|nr:hypothetical protein ABW20_dc0108890 [Dactylellina cionopaga]
MLFLRPIGLRLTIGLSVPTLYLSSQILYPRRLRCQAAPYLHDRILEARQSQSSIGQQRSPEDSVDGTIFNPTNFRQISTGSFTGVLTGYAVGKLSRMLMFVTILVFMVVQYAERKGIHLVPWQRLRGVVDEADMKRAMTDNWAFKWSFASTAALSAWFAN